MSLILSAFKDVKAQVARAGEGIGHGITHGQGAVCPLKMITKENTMLGENAAHALDAGSQFCPIANECRELG